jgi:hypothetical protein
MKRLNAMRFSQYVNDNWNAKEFCHKLANEARSAWHNIFEMAMATQKIADPKFPILHDADDYKFLSQFPYNVWSQALNWRYNQGLRDMMRKANAEDRTHIPEDHDWTNQITFPVGHGKFYRFGGPNHPATIYTGLTTLAKKLTKPVKGYPEYIEKHPDDPDSPHPHWEPEGPSLREIDPNETNPEHPAHPNKYKHGLYDFDLADMAEVSDEDIDEIPDTDIQAMLGPPLSKQNVKNPEVQAAIQRIRAKMKKVKKHTFSAYNVPQLGTSQDNMSDWLVANALGLYGNHPDEYFDELTGKKHPVRIKTPAEMSSKYKMAFKKKADEEEGFSLKHNIPTIEKHLDFVEVDPKNNKVTPKAGTYTIPYLNPQKGVPQLHKGGPFDITPEQRVKIAQLRAKEESKTKKKPKFAPWASEWYLKPGESWHEALKRFGPEFGEASKIDTFKNFLKFWDIWTDDQKLWLKKNAKSLHDMAKRVHSKDEELGKDQLMKPQNLYAAGPRPNYLSQGQGVLHIPPEQMGAFKAKYLGKLMTDLLGDKTEGAGQGYEGNGLIDKILKRMRRDPKYPPQVIAALESRATDLATFAAYNLLTWLNDPQYGIKDPEFNLLTHENVDEEENAIRRAWKVEWFLKSAAQIGFNDVLSRRRREKAGMGYIGTLDTPVGDTGKTGAGQVTAGQKPKETHDLPAKRRWLNSDPGSIARAGQKSHSLISQSEEFFAQRRRQLLRKLQGMPGIESDLQKAEKAIDNALEMSIELYQKYDKELEASIPDEIQREEEIMKRIHAALSKHESLSHSQIEDVMAKTKTLWTAGKTDADDLKIKEAMDNFMNEFMKVPQGKGIRIPVWNDMTKQAVASAKEIVPSEIPAQPHKVAELIAHIYQNRPKLVLGALKQWGYKVYEKIADMHDDIEKETSQLQEEWQEEMAKWENEFAKEYKFKPEEPIAMPKPQQQQATQPQPVAAKALTQSLPELFALADKVGNVDDMLKLGQALLDKKTELIAQPGSAVQLEKAIEAMRQRRKFFINTPGSPQEYKIMNQLLPHLVAELEAAHG